MRDIGGGEHYERNNNMKNKELEKIINEWKSKNEHRLKNRVLLESKRSVEDVMGFMDAWVTDTDKFLKEHKNENKRNS